MNSVSIPNCQPHCYLLLKQIYTILFLLFVLTTCCQIQIKNEIAIIFRSIQPVGKVGSNP